MAVPSDTIRILGPNSSPVITFSDDAGTYAGIYCADAVFFRELEALMRRLYTEQRMSADEMRDWANLLNLRLERVVPLDN